MPTPTITSRDTSSPAGATMSSALPFLPLKRSAAAARVHQVAGRLEQALRAAGPNFSPSSQNRMRTPLAGVENGANPSLQGVGHGRLPLVRRLQD